MLTTLSRENISYTHDKPLAHYKLYIAGKWVETKETLTVYNPYDQSQITRVSRAKSDHVDLALSEAQMHLKHTSKVAAYERKRILLDVANQMKEKIALFTTTIATESSKTLKEAHKEVKRAINTITLSAEEAGRLSGETIPFDAAEGSENKLGYFYRQPVGIITAITPYNDPLNLVCHKIGPAIAGGNSVILKPATLTPISALLLVELFDKAGTPHGMLSLLTGNASEIGEKLVGDPRVRMVSFTGGVDAGEVIAKQAGLKKLSMELGSNSPTIVLEDADLNKAAKALVPACFYAAGQNCIGAQIDPDANIGPVITQKDAKRIRHMIADAVNKGAKILTGESDLLSESTLVQPTLLANVPKDAIISQQEVFGPVAYLQPVEDLEAAINLANSTEYGLHAAIFTKDINKAFYAINYLNCGNVLVNESTDYRVDFMPFGGVKKSGLGREGIRFSLEEMTELKMVCIDLSGDSNSRQAT